ncbi:MAG TPA: Uma2 family endonuclease [Blastocatellia bacterium]|nr:Uma2 family endonuclease [Blastocatellia bacterium]
MKSPQLTFTIADLDSFPDDGNIYEIIEGELFVSRSPGFVHQCISSNLFAGLKSHCDINSLGYVLAGMGLILDDFNGVIPDIIFVSNERCDHILSGDRLIGSPELVIEILSPGSSNERRDRKLKREIYARFGVNEYWIVDPENRTLELYSLKENALELMATFHENDDVTSLVLSGLKLSLKDVFKG